MQKNLLDYAIERFNIKTIYFQESSITEAVEKQLQGASSASSQPSLTPQMGKKPQMGTHLVSQQQQHEQPATPLSGNFFFSSQWWSI